MKNNHTVNCQPLTINCRRSRPGQALVTLLVFVSITTIITAAAVTITIINSQTTSKFATGEEALFVAEAGAENAVLKLLRNPAYSGSLPTENLAVGNGQVTIDINGSPTVTITSTGTVSNFIRKVQVTATYSNNQFTITSWQTIN